MNLLWGALKWSIVVGAAALALTLLKPLLDRRYSPRWRYWAWLVMALMLLLGPLPWGELLPQSGGASPALRIEVPRMELTVSREEEIGRAHV